MITGVVPQAAARTTLTRHPVAPRRARVWAHTALCGWSIAHHQISSGAVDDVVLVISELVSNSLIHARGEIRASLVLGCGCVRVEVRDGGPALHRAARADQDADGEVYGRGLAITSTVATRCGWSREPGHATAWATVPLSPAAAA